MSTPIKPILSHTSSDKVSLWAALSHAFRQHEMNSDQMLPAQVISFDRTNNIATVQPMIVVVNMDDSQVNRPQIAYVPVISLGGGGFHISFPLKQGDLGWIYAADRDLSLFHQSLAMSPPNTSRAHDFSDSMFIPDVFRKYTINGEDSAYMVIQSTDGATRISIRPDNIKITAPTKVLVDVPLSEFTGNVTIDKNLVVEGNTSVTGNATVTGATQVNGGFAAAGGQACTLPATTTVNAINVSSHGHISESPGTRTGGGMIA
jgi:hypothetical protein